VTLPSFADGRVQVGVRGQYIDAPDVAFYGIGNESPDTRMGYAYRTSTIGTTAQLHAVGPFTVGAGLDAMRFETTLNDTALALDPNYRRTRLFAQVDTRTSPGYSRSGGLYRVDWADYHQTNAGAESFRRVDAEVRQFIPLMHENWVLALRGLVSSTDASTGQDVPYFMLPDLGGSHNLRGYSTWRFRDRNRLLLSGEYRWTAGPFVDMALFLDAGKVAPKTADLDLSGLTKTYGVGLSLHSFTRTAARIELAHTPDGMSLGISFSPSF
jgi:outer membrane protein assembly factor BamA